MPPRHIWQEIFDTPSDDNQIEKPSRVSATWDGRVPAEPALTPPIAFQDDYLLQSLGYMFVGIYVGG